MIRFRISLPKTGSKNKFQQNLNKQITQTLESPLYDHLGDVCGLETGINLAMRLIKPFMHTLGWKMCNAMFTGEDNLSGKTGIVQFLNGLRVIIIFE